MEYIFDWFLMAYLNRVNAFLENIINCFIMILLDQAGFMMKLPK